MRLLVIALSALLMLGFLGFVMMNLDVRADVTLWNTRYEGVSLHLIVVLALLAGIVYAGLIGVAQGTQLWLANCRLRREVQRLEAELRTLRTPSPAAVPSEVAPAEGGPLTPEGRTEPASEGPGLPVAPVYRSEDEADDEDVYSGERAV